MFYHYCRYHLIIGMPFDDTWAILIRLPEQYILWPNKCHIFENTIVGVFCMHITWPSCKLMPSTVTMTVKQLILKEQIQCHWPRDGGHSTAEYHDPVCICYKQHEQRYAWEQLAMSYSWYYSCKLLSPKVCSPYSNAQGVGYLQRDVHSWKVKKKRKYYKYDNGMCKMWLKWFALLIKCSTNYTSTTLY